MPSSQTSISLQFNQGYYDKFFIEQSKLGRGHTGTVFKVRHVIDNIELGLFAIKCVPIGEQKSYLVKILKEVGVLTRLKHDNVVEYKHCWIEDRKVINFGPVVACLFVLMELCDGGSLEDYIYPGFQFDLKTSRIRTTLHEIDHLNNSKRYGGLAFENGIKVRFLTTAQIMSIFTDITRGLKHLHDNNIIHCDLKPSNLLLQFDNSAKLGTPRILISDFGESIEYRDLEFERTGSTGTIEFTAPELLVNDGGCYKGCHDYQTDLWSLGIILYFLCYSRLPFSQVEDVDELRKEILQFRIEKLQIQVCNRVDSLFVELMFKLLGSKGERPDCDYVLQKLESSGITMVENLSVTKYTFKEGAMIRKPSDIHVASDKFEFDRDFVYSLQGNGSSGKQGYSRKDSVHESQHTIYKTLKALEYPTDTVNQPSADPGWDLKIISIIDNYFHIAVLATSYLPILFQKGNFNLKSQGVVLFAGIALSTSKQKFGFSRFTISLAFAYTGIVAAAMLVGKGS